MSLPADTLPFGWSGFCELWRRIGMLHKSALNRDRFRALYDLRNKER